MNKPILFTSARMNDSRGYFKKILNPIKLREFGIQEFRASEMFTTVTRQNGIRGMHIQVSPCASRKLIWVTQGEILDVVVDTGSKEIFTFDLSENAENLLYVPHNLAHGFQVLSSSATVNYLTDVPYCEASDVGFNPLTFGFKWPRPVSVVSNRDQRLPSLRDFRAFD
jgi:dTDP-4-dehydrorhamnose 3,5-epimerase